MTTFGQLSQKLAGYLREIESETGRQIEFVFTDKLGLPGMSAAFVENPSLIVVLLASGSQVTDRRLEHSIAHEVTHGLLLYKLGYSRPVPKCRLYDKDKRNLSLVCTMIEDIVVNKIIHEAGFSPFSPDYLAVVRRETKSARSGVDHYHIYSADPQFKTRFMVFRYIMAWGFTQYFDLETNARTTIVTFMDSFDKSFPEKSAIAGEIRELVLQNDIFTAAGHYIVVGEVLKLWHLENLVELEAV